jgi:predicted deacylase
MNQHYQGFWLLRDDYHSYQQIIDLMDSLATTFPTICKKVIFGYSVQGRQCAALKISDNVTMHEAEPKVLFDGSIHGDEIGGAENLVRFARELCVNYATDTNIAYLINNREIWLYCMVNPDGRVNMSRYNYNGVDVNRDFGYMWDAWGGSPAAFSQPESRANRDWSYNNEPTIFITYHSGDEICLYPWGYRYNTCPDDDHQSYLAKMYSDSSLYPNLAYGMAATDLYAVNGASDDANYGMLGTISFTVEMSNNKQPPTYQIQLYYSRNKTAMLQMLRQAGYGLCGTVTDSLTGTPIKAMVFINNFYPTYTGDSTGYFHKFVLGGTYSIKIVANGYKTKEIDSISVLANSTTTLNFQLVPQPGQYAFKIAASQIPGNNFADEGNTPAALGPPDSVSYSIGKNGWCIFDMQNPIVDGYGDDLKIYDGGTTPEGFTCFVSGSKDGPWTQLGTGIGFCKYRCRTSSVCQDC